ncbi:MAG: four helix bundle protein [Bacteroidales bacterium]|jgi:four helix bundle protein
MKLEDLQIYSQSMDLAEKIWTFVQKWDYFAKDTIGKQLVRAADSIRANISEGFGRFHFRENVNFGYYSRGSFFETKTWLVKTRNRKLIEESEFKLLITELDDLGVRLNNYIKSIGKTENN